MNRDDLVSVRVAGGGAAAFAAGEKYALKIAKGEIAQKWSDGSPITRGEFESVLAPHGPFELADEMPAQ
jgi:hypothetical protein